MGSLNQRLSQLEKGLPRQPADPGSDAALWAALNDPTSLALRDEHLAALAAGETARAADLTAQIEAHLQAIAGGVS